MGRAGPWVALCRSMISAARVESHGVTCGKRADFPTFDPAMLAFGVGESSWSLAWGDRDFLSISGGKSSGRAAPRSWPCDAAKASRDWLGFDGVASLASDPGLKRPYRQAGSPVRSASPVPAAVTNPTMTKTMPSAETMHRRRESETAPIKQVMVAVDEKYRSNTQPDRRTPKPWVVLIVPGVGWRCINRGVPSLNDFPCSVGLPARPANDWLRRSINHGLGSVIAAGWIVGRNRRHLRNHRSRRFDRTAGAAKGKTRKDDDRAHRHLHPIPVTWSWC
jgi:hypothetical protein